jgi:hypothetical protein
MAKPLTLHSMTGGKERRTSFLLQRAALNLQRNGARDYYGPAGRENGR